MSSLILDINNIKNQSVLSSTSELEAVFDTICTVFHFQVLHRFRHTFEPQGSTIVFALSESHMALHSFPESDTVSFDLFTCRPNCEEDLREIQNYLLRELRGSILSSVIMKRPEYTLDRWWFHKFDSLNTK